MYGAHIPTMPSLRHATLPGAQHAAHGHELPGILTYLFPSSASSKIPAWIYPHTCQCCQRSRWIVFWGEFLKPVSHPLNPSPPHLSRQQLRPLDEHCSPRAPPTSLRLSALLMWTSPTFGLLPLNLPPCNPHLGPTGGLVMGYSQAEAQPLLTTLQAQPQDSPGAGGPLNFGPLHSLPPVFTSGLSTTTLPRFHQAFRRLGLSSDPGSVRGASVPVHLHPP